MTSSCMAVSPLSFFRVAAHAIVSIDPISVMESIYARSVPMRAPAESVLKFVMVTNAQNGVMIVDMTRKIGAMGAVMIKERLVAPPREVYFLPLYSSSL